MRPIPRLPALIGSAVAMLLAAGAPAHAAYVGTGGDPTGDATDGNPAHDIVGFGASYGPADGSLVGVLRLAGRAGGANEYVRAHVMVGFRTPSGCNGFPAVGLQTYPSAEGALVRWVRFGAADDPRPKDGFGRQQVLDGGHTLRFEVSDTDVAGLKADCAVAWTVNEQTPGVLVDTASATVLRAQPELVAEAGKMPPSQRVGQRRKVRVVLRNPGHAKTGRIRLSVAKARGLSVQHPKTIASLKPGAKRTVTLTTSLTSSAKASTRLRVTASAGDLRARVDGRLRRAGTSGGSGSGQPTPPQTCNRWMPDLSGETGGSLVLVPC